MQKLVKSVRELDAADRKRIEEVFKSPVSDDQQVVLEPAAASAPGLSKKYHVYEGLSDQEIDELEKIILDRDDW